MGKPRPEDPLPSLMLECEKRAEATRQRNLREERRLRHFVTDKYGLMYHLKVKLSMLDDETSQYRKELERTQKGSNTTSALLVRPHHIQMNDIEYASKVQSLDMEDARFDWDLYRKVYNKALWPKRRPPRVQTKRTPESKESQRSESEPLIPRTQLASKRHVQSGLDTDTLKQARSNVQERLAVRGTKGKGISAKIRWKTLASDVAVASKEAIVAVDSLGMETKEEDVNNKHNFEESTEENNEKSEEEERDLEKYRGDGRLRTMYSMPDEKQLIQEARKARYVRSKEQEFAQRELSVTDIFKKKKKRTFRQMSKKLINVQRAVRR